MPNTPLQHLIDQFTQIKQKLELDAKQKRMQFDYQFHKNKVIFEKTLHRAHKQLKTGALRYLVGANPLYIFDSTFYLCHDRSFDFARYFCFFVSADMFSHLQN